MVAPQWQKALKGMRVMVIEPHAATREILGSVLTTHGMVPELYASVADALQDQRGHMNRRQRGAYPGVIRHIAALIERHVEIDAQEHALPVQIKICD